MRIPAISLPEPDRSSSLLKIFSQIGAQGDLTGFDSTASFGGLPLAATVCKGDIIFPRLDMAKELEALAGE